jgi:heat shock protein HtpX
VYQQIARNKRMSVLYAALFFTVWVGVGALVGLVAETTTGAVVAGASIAAAFALAGIVFALRSGARLVLAVAGARPADPREFAELHHVVEALAIGAGLPKPDVYVVDDASPNAFATGTGPGHAAITATTGLLAVMNREELEGVISHEMSHIKNYDVRLLLVVSTLIGMAGLLASLIWRGMWFGRGARRDQAGLVILAAGLLLGLVAVVFGPLMRLALSRRREELADVSGVELTRNPAGLISALEILQRNDQPLAKVNHATAAMCIDDPLQHHAGWFHRLFDTHPPISERIAVLQRIATGQLT